MRRRISDDDLVNASFDELAYIMKWASMREDEGGVIRTILIGGWAVYAYNQYFGSYDIDLVINKRTRSTLMQHLHDERGYKKVGDDHTTFKGIEKPIPGSEGIKIDFASFTEEGRFEGREEILQYELYRERAVEVEVQDLMVTVPDRGMMLISKLKAAWNRSWNLENRELLNPAWERGKLIKDRADILALIDPLKGGKGIDLEFLGDFFANNPFIIDALRIAGTDRDGIRRYIIEPETARENVETLLELTT
jgi:hypothetical protein